MITKALQPSCVCWELLHDCFQEKWLMKPFWILKRTSKVNGVWSLADALVAGFANSDLKTSHPQSSNQSLILSVSSSSDQNRFRSTGWGRHWLSKCLHLLYDKRTFLLLRFSFPFWITSTVLIICCNLCSILWKRLLGSWLLS